MTKKNEENLSKQNKYLKITCIILASIILIISICFITTSISKNTVNEKEQDKTAHEETSESIVLVRHDLDYYSNYIEKYIVTTKKFNIFEDNFDERAKFIISIEKSGFRDSEWLPYLSIDQAYNGKFSGHIKKENVNYGRCYNYEYISTAPNGNGVNGALDNSFRVIEPFTDTIAWGKECGHSDNHFYHRFITATETDDGFIITVAYNKAVLHTDPATGEVWYEVKNNDGTTEKFSCGYDKGSCKPNAVNKYLESNLSKTYKYRFYFKVIDDIEALYKIEKSDQDSSS